MVINDKAINLLCEKFTSARAILVGAGAGLSAAAGLDYSGPAFRAAFADYIKKYGFPDLYTSSFHEFPTEEERWARWARHVDYARYKPGAFPLYKELLNLVCRKDYFVITTNVDGQFKKAGFNPLKVFEVQGDYGLMQCARGCHPTRYSNYKLVREMVEKSKDLKIPSELVPRCPVCGGNMDINVRKNNFFVQDQDWEDAAARYEEFIKKYIASDLLLLELGVGFNTPDIIRYPFEEIARLDPHAFLARLNNMDDACPVWLAGRSVAIKADINASLEMLAAKIQE